MLHLLLVSQHTCSASWPGECPPVEVAHELVAKECLAAAGEADQDDD